jgi:hypothetical protein
VNIAQLDCFVLFNVSERPWRKQREKAKEGERVLWRSKSFKRRLSTYIFGKYFDSTRRLSTCKIILAIGLEPL